MRLTELDYLILGLLYRNARTAYAAGRAIAEMPASRFSGSPGAVYPAIRRLETNGLLTAAGRTADGRRGVVWTLSDRGRDVFEAWVRAPVTADEMIASPGLVMVRISFLGAVLSEETELDDYLARLTKTSLALRREVASYREAARADLEDSPDLGLLLLEELARAYCRWSRQAIRGAKALSARP